jgi:hypothetical protein
MHRLLLTLFLTLPFAAVLAEEVQTEDPAVEGLVEKTEPLADGERVRLVVVDGADNFFRDLYSEDVADTIAAELEGL